MKTKPALLVLVAAMLAFAPHARAQADLYSTVTNLWWNGPKTNLLALAEQRLAAAYPRDALHEDGWLDGPATNAPPAVP